MTKEYLPKQYPVSTFAKKVGFPRANAKGLKRSLRYLENKKVLVVTQGGYRGHSTHHHKNVVVYDWDAVELHFGLGLPNPTDDVNEVEVELVKMPAERPNKVPKESVEVKVDLKFCVSCNACEKQVIIEKLPYPLCKTPKVYCLEQVGAAIELPAGGWVW